MKLFLFALALAFPLGAELGSQSVDGLSIIAIASCSDVDPLNKRMEAPPRCAFVMIKASRSDVTGFLVTVTYDNAAGEHSAQMRWIDRWDDVPYTALSFWGTEGGKLKTLEIEQCSDESGCFDWHQFRLD